VQDQLAQGFGTQRMLRGVVMHFAEQQDAMAYAG
jgi:hypothetical protein